MVRFWQSFNHHIAAVMDAADPHAVTRPRGRHNLDQLAWRSVSAMQSTTLGYFMTDYVDHLKHHLRQALEQR